MTDRNSSEAVGLVPPAELAGISGLDFLRRLLDGTYPSPPFSKEMDIWPIAFESGHVIFEATPSSRFYNPIGIVHGGWIATLLDSAMGCAVHSILPAGQTFVTLEMKTVSSKPSSSGPASCDARARCCMPAVVPRVPKAKSMMPPAVSSRTARKPVSSWMDAANPLRRAASTYRLDWTFKGLRPSQRIAAKI